MSLFVCIKCLKLFVLLKNSYSCNFGMCLRFWSQLYFLGWKQDHLRMNVAPDQTIILGRQIILDHRSLSSLDQKILMTPLIDTSPWSYCSRQSSWLPCSGHTISSTEASVSPFRDFLIGMVYFLWYVVNLHV